MLSTFFLPMVKPWPRTFVTVCISVCLFVITFKPFNRFSWNLVWMSCHSKPLHKYVILKVYFAGAWGRKDSLILEFLTCLGYVTSTCSMNGGDEKWVYNFIHKTEGKNHSVDLGVDGRIILKCILNRVWGCGPDHCNSEEGPFVGRYGLCNEPLGFLIDREFLDYLCNCWLLSTGLVNDVNYTVQSITARM
jgi:hypothetical protein